MHTFILTIQLAGNQINYPNIPYPKLPPHFSLFFPPSLSPPDAAVLNLGQW